VRPLRVSSIRSREGYDAGVTAFSESPQSRGRREGGAFGEVRRVFRWGVIHRASGAAWRESSATALTPITTTEGLGRQAAEKIDARPGALQLDDTLPEKVLKRLACAVFASVDT